MKRKLFSITVILLLLNISIYASDETERILDRSLEEFSNKNYSLALDLIIGVLAIEPDNSTAKLYKKTIEDVIALDNADTAIDGTEVEAATIEKQESSVKNLNSSVSKDEEVIKSESFETLSFTTLVSSTFDNKYTYLSQKIKLIVGVPFFDFEIVSDQIKYNIMTINSDTIPFSRIFDFNYYNIDFGVGYRFQPFKESVSGYGFVDVKIGMKDLGLSKYLYVPYIGFDSELFILKSILKDNILNNIWIGGSGAIFSNDGQIVNNYKLQGKAGIKIGFYKVGLFYSSESYSFSKINLNTFGLYSSLSF